MKGWKLFWDERTGIIWRPELVPVRLISRSFSCIARRFAVNGTQMPGNKAWSAVGARQGSGQFSSGVEQRFCKLNTHLACVCRGWPGWAKGQKPRKLATAACAGVSLRKPGFWPRVTGLGYNWRGKPGDVPAKGCPNLALDCLSFARERPSEAS